MLHSCSLQQSLQVIHHHWDAYHQVALKIPGLTQSLSPAISKFHTFLTSVNVVFLFLLSVVVSWWSLFSCDSWKWHYFAPSALYLIPSSLPHYSYMNSLSFFEPRPINCTTFTSTDFLVMLPSFPKILEHSSLFLSPPLLVLPSMVTLHGWTLQHLAPHHPNLPSFSCPFSPCPSTPAVKPCHWQ